MSLQACRCKHVAASMPSTCTKHAAHMYQACAWYTAALRFTVLCCAALWCGAPGGPGWRSGEQRPAAAAGHEPGGVPFRGCPSFSGHYHKPHVVAGSSVEYVGSPYQTSLAEAGQAKRLLLLRAPGWQVRPYPDCRLACQTPAPCPLRRLAGQTLAPCPPRRLAGQTLPYPLFEQSKGKAGLLLGGRPSVRGCPL